MDCDSANFSQTKNTLAPRCGFGNTAECGSDIGLTMFETPTGFRPFPALLPLDLSVAALAPSAVTFTTF